MLSGIGQSEAWHIVVYAFVCAFLDEKRLVPYSDVAAAADLAVECRPGRNMLRRLVLCIPFQLIERAPVLNHDRRSAEPRLVAEKA